MRQKKKQLSGILAVSLAVSLLPAAPFSLSGTVQAAETTSPVETVIEKTQVSNPIGGYDADGNLLYGGDPAVMVDGDTVYLYTGHDTAQSEAYEIVEWMCYSTKDLKNWKYENVIMKADKGSITWANTGKDAWAAQMVKYKNKYYFYYCTWDATADGKQSIGVATSDSPTGPFTDLGKPLVKGTVTTPESSGWNDIDPTVYIEKDNKGVEHRYLAWGNGKYYICELNEDMISVKDQNGDGKITSGTSTTNADIIEQTPVSSGFTEAPWLYRRKDASGNPTGPYYLFYAYQWREEMAYSTTDDLMKGSWTFGGQLMPPAATSNTNHMAVFDFKDKTYFVYHNGSLPGGSGFRRNACIAELHFNADGSIQAIPETAIGITGDKPEILYTDNGIALSHEKFTNSSTDGDYPYTKVKVGAYFQPEDADSQWAIIAGKADPKKDSYVSIQSENKPGLYLTVNDDDTITLAQDAKYSVVSGKITADADTAKAQTFRTVKGLSDEKAVSFESVAKPGYYMCLDGGDLVVKELAKCDAGANFYLNQSPVSDSTNTNNLAKENDLSSLTIDDKAVTAENAVYSYTVPYTASTVALKVTAQDPKGIITLDGKVLSSSGSKTILLNGAETEYEICVYAEDQKSKKTYTLKINKDFSGFKFTGEPVRTFNFNNNTGGAAAVTKASVPTVKSDASYQYTAGKFGQAIILDGTYGLKLCDAATLGSSYTISFWMKPDTIGGAVDPTLTAGTFSPEYWLNLTFDAKIWSKKTDYIATPAANAYEAGKWQNVILSVDGNTAGTAADTVTAHLYLNGTLISSGDIAKDIMTNANAVIYFGVNAWDAYFKGAVDDIRIFNTALNENDAIALATATEDLAENVGGPSDIPGDPGNNNSTDPSEIPTDPDDDNNMEPGSDTEKTVKKVVITKKGSKKAIKKTQTLQKKKTLKLAATVKTTGGASKKVTWKSSNKKIATVSAKGVVKAKSKKGTVKITATSKADKTKKCTIKVKVK